MHLYADTYRHNSEPYKYHVFASLIFQIEQESLVFLAKRTLTNLRLAHTMADAHARQGADRVSP